MPPFPGDRNFRCVAFNQRRDGFLRPLGAQRVGHRVKQLVKAGGRYFIFVPRLLWKIVLVVFSPWR
jgi:hypothetical protein